MAGLHKAIADRFGVGPENVVTGCGSTQVLRVAVQVYTSPVKPIVTGQLSYEECAGYADLIGTPVRAIPLDRSLQLDLGAMADAAPGAGMVFLNNPNNPTGALHSGDAVDAFIERVLAASPEAVVLIDEAYHDYVTDPSHRTQVAARGQGPARHRGADVFEGARHGRDARRLRHRAPRHDQASGMGRPQRHERGRHRGRRRSIKDQARLDREKARNTEARRFTLDWFCRAGFSGTDSQTNFVFVDIKRPAKGFREACREQGVLVARDFPPLEKSHVRISIGTIEEMKRAVEVFGKVLGVKAKAA